MPKFIAYQGIGFNQEWAASKTFAEFSKHEKHHGLTEEQLREVWEVAKGKKELSEVSTETEAEVVGAPAGKKKEK